MRLTPSIMERVARSHSATTRTSPVPSSSIAFQVRGGCGSPFRRPFHDRSRRSVRHVAHRVGDPGSDWGLRPAHIKFFALKFYPDLLTTRTSRKCCTLASGGEQEIANALA